MKIDWKEEKIDITQIHSETLEAIAGMYAYAQFFHGENFLQGSPRKQRKVRKHLEKNYAEWIRNQVGGIAAYFDDSESDAEVLHFLEQCYKEQISRGITNRGRFEEGTAHLSKKTAEALWQLAGDHTIYGITNDGTLRFEQHNNCAFKSTLVLSNVTGFPTNPDIPVDKNPADCGDIGIEFYDLTVGENDYSITGDIIFYGDYNFSSSKVTLNFTDVHLESECYCATDDSFFENPWFYLGRIARDICLKSFLTDLTLNEQEQELLPLLAELASIMIPWSLPKEHTRASYPHLTALVTQYGYEKLLSKIAAIEKEEPSSPAHNTRAQQLTQAMCEQAYEPMWRDVWERLVESQKNYPSKAALHVPAEILTSTRNSIEQLMHQHGYSGSYPDFVQHGPLRGIHLEESYNMTYFVGMEKDITYHIHCSETIDESDYLNIQFLCGTALNQKGKTCEDIYSCLFNAKGKRLFHTMHYDCNLDPDAPVNLKENATEIKKAELEKSVRIAVKKNHLQRLTNEERKFYHGADAGSLLALFCIIFIGGGLLFGTAMTLASMLITLLVVLIFGQFPEFPRIFMDFPWWQLFLFYSVSYGLSMGLLTVLAKRK